MSYGVGRRCTLDLMLLWLWCRLEATALIRPLAWEPPYATGAALKRHTQKNLSVNEKSLKQSIFGDLSMHYNEIDKNVGYFYDRKQFKI